MRIGNRNYIGIEIDENYIELTNKRLNDIDNKESFLWAVILGKLYLINII